MSRELQPRSTAEKKRFSSTAVHAIHQRRRYACSSVGAIPAASLLGHRVLSLAPRGPREASFIVGALETPLEPARDECPHRVLGFPAGPARLALGTRAAPGAHAALGSPPPTGSLSGAGRSCLRAKDSWRTARLLHRGPGTRCPAPGVQNRASPSPQRSARGRARSEAAAGRQPASSSRKDPPRRAGGRGSRVAAPGHPPPPSVFPWPGGENSSPPGPGSRGPCPFPRRATQVPAGSRSLPAAATWKGPQAGPSRPRRPPLTRGACPSSPVQGGGSGSRRKSGGS